MNNYIEAAKILKQGGVIAYPTEAVFGFGCDPFNEKAVNKILSLKKRSVDKGLILIASNWNQIKDLTKLIPQDKLNIVLNSWPGPYTWIFPSSDKVPHWISGKFDSIALRVSAHPTVQNLCNAYNGPIVSTSANPENKPPARSIEEVKNYFPNELDLILGGEVDTTKQPSMIKDAVSGEVLR